ncbi:MAG: zinc-binding dehydrogenase [Myxococcaceae bacterium]|nr:zinc-binding dehydrogenase [Myxococcaceae bacterium]
MRAVGFTRHGGPEVLEVIELPTPQPKAREVRVKVKAVALNHLDVWVRKGWPGLKLELPHVLGADIAGVVDAVGSEVGDLEPGTEVCVNPGVSCGVCDKCLLGADNLCRQYTILGEHIRGGYAEYVCVPRHNLLPKPKRLSFEQAACLPLTFLTAWTMLVRRAQLSAGETVLIHAAGSGVGSAGIQIARRLGATVIATTSTDEKAAKARQLGAHHVINYATHDFVTEVKRLTNKKLVDVVFEHTGASTWDKSVACLPYGGRLVTCGATAGSEVKLDLRVLFYKRISLLGSTMGSKGDLFRILQLVDEGAFEPVLDRVLPLAEAAAAHGLLSERKSFGNVVLVP